MQIDRLIELGLYGLVWLAIVVAWESYINDD
jgi:hypothetical protein